MPARPRSHWFYRIVTMPHRILKVAENGMIEAYESLLKARGFKPRRFGIE